MKKHPVVLLTLLLAACGGEKTPNADSAAMAAAPPPAPAPMPSLTIVSPANGDTTKRDVTIVMTKSGMTIAKADGARVEGTGHFHLFVDTAVTADGQVVPPTTKKIIHIGSGDSTFTIKGLAVGPHTIIAAVGYGDHSTMAGARDTVSFVVKK